MLDRSLEFNKIMEATDRPPTWVNDIRRKAELILNRVKPRKDRHFDEKKLIREWFSGKKYKTKGKTVTPNFKPDLDNSINIFIVNGILQEIYDPNRELRNNNVVVKNLSDVDIEYVEKIKGFIYSSIENDASLIELYSLLTFNRGIYVHIPSGVSIGSPIRILRYYTQGDIEISELNITIIGENSYAKLIEEVRDANLYNHIKVVYNHKIRVGSGSTVKTAYIHNVSSKVNTVNIRKIVASRYSHIESTYAWLGGNYNYSEITNILNGEYSNVNHVEIVFGSNVGKYTLYSSLKHIAQGTHGRILNRGALKDSARLVYNGLIDIGNEAYKSDALLESHIILLNRGASAFDVPGLEIKTNDVRATHSASVSPIDEEQVYYLKTRGLSDDEARRLIVFGALQPAIERISSDKVKLAILSRLEEIWGSSMHL